MPADPESTTPRSDHWLDALAKRLATPSSRRSTLARLGGSIAAAVAASLLPRARQAEAQAPIRRCTETGECPPGQTCLVGLCLNITPAASCPPGWRECGGRCVDTQFDPNNCGGCNVTCPYGIPCTYGACIVEFVPAPNAGCANTVSDPNNCGRCGNVCPAPANATAGCVNAACTFVCNPGFKLCSGVCIPIGSCCTAGDCPAGPPSATVICSNGQCSFVCPPVTDTLPDTVAAWPGVPVDPAAWARAFPATPALADLARPPAADGGTSTFNTGLPCCINSDCVNGSLFLNSTLLNSLCVNGTCLGFNCIPPGNECSLIGMPCCLGFCNDGLCGELRTVQSDRSLKDNFADVDPAEILDRVASLPISSWNYKQQDAAIRHIGPMAQDFAAAFGVGEDDRHINLIDGQGVALAAIQELSRRLEEQQRQIQTLAAQNAALLTKLAPTTDVCPALPDPGASSGS